MQSFLGILASCVAALCGPSTELTKNGRLTTSWSPPKMHISHIFLCLQYLPGTVEQQSLTQLNAYFVAPARFCTSVDTTGILFLDCISVLLDKETLAIAFWETDLIHGVTLRKLVKKTKMITFFSRRFQHVNAETILKIHVHAWLLHKVTETKEQRGMKGSTGRDDRATP